MSGILVGELILWLIVAIVAIVIGVYIVNWLYHRSSKEVSFVRTGFLGERVVINGGAFELPFIHDYTPVNMNASISRRTFTSACRLPAKPSRSPPRRSDVAPWSPSSFTRCFPANLSPPSARLLPR
jgi:hypothetical protein